MVMEGQLVVRKNGGLRTSFTFTHAPYRLQVYMILEHLDGLDEDQKIASAIVERRCCCNSM